MIRLHSLLSVKHFLNSTVGKRTKYVLTLTCILYVRIYLCKKSPTEGFSGKMLGSAKSAQTLTSSHFFLKGAVSECREWVRLCSFQGSENGLQIFWSITHRWSRNSHARPKKVFLYIYNK